MESRCHRESSSGPVAMFAKYHVSLAAPRAVPIIHLGPMQEKAQVAVLFQASSLT